MKQFAIDQPKQPMRGLTWYEAYAYCQWLSKIMMDHPFTLPTEAQWEKAARGTDSRKWANGNDWRLEFTDVNKGGVPRQYPRECGIVGSESPYGCQDMIGQVWNWTLSIDPPLRGGHEVEDPAELVKNLDAWRIIRGGSWRHNQNKATTYHRESQSPVPDDYRYEIGFRIATPLNPDHLLEEQ